MKKPLQNLLGLLFLCGTLFSCAHAVPTSTANRHPADGALSSWIWFYRGPLDHLRAVRSGQCPMYPSCSDYSRQALEQHGFAMGAIMMFDRLMRCGRDEVHLSPPVLVDGRRRTYDPLEANDFWWYRRTKRHATAPLTPPVPAAPAKTTAAPADRKAQGRAAGGG